MVKSHAERAHQKTMHSLTQKLNSRRALQDPTYAERIRWRIKRAQYFYQLVQRPKVSAGAW